MSLSRLLRKPVIGKDFLKSENEIQSEPAWLNRQDQAPTGNLMR